MKAKFTNIVWDTDGEQVDLPSETIIELPDGFDYQNEGADLLSDIYGWCVQSFEFFVIPSSHDKWLEAMNRNPEIGGDFDYSMNG